VIAAHAFALSVRQRPWACSLQPPDASATALLCSRCGCRRTAQALHAVGLSTQWQSYLDFDIALDGTTVAGVLSG
jgi:hypothetical protein